MNAPKAVFLIAFAAASIPLAVANTAIAFQQVDLLPPDTSNNASAGFALLSDGSVYGKSGPSAGVVGNVNPPLDGTFWGAPAPFYQTINLGTPVGLGRIDMNDAFSAVGQASAPIAPFNLTGFVTENALTAPVTTLLAPNSVSRNRSRANSINNSDVIVGTSYNFDLINGETLHSGTVWRKSTGYTPEITTLVNEPLSISNNGNIVGWEGSNTGAVTKIGNVMGQVLPFTGDIGGLNGVGPTFGQDINNASQTVGYAFDQATPTKVITAFIWDPSTGMTGVNHSSVGAIESRGWAVNNHGLMVGTLNMRNGSGTFPDQAFCYYQGQLINLNDLIDPNSGWELWHAYDVNDDGWITGVGKFNGDFQGFRMLHAIPEPASLVSLFSGLFAMLIGGRRRQIRFAVACVPTYKH